MVLTRAEYENLDTFVVKWRLTTRLRSV